MKRTVLFLLVCTILAVGLSLVETDAAFWGPWDNCTGAMVGLFAARYQLNACLDQWAGLVPISHCTAEIA